MSRISTKSEFLHLNRSHSLGNRLRYWESIQDIPPYKGPISIRSRRAGENINYTHIPWNQLPKILGDIVEQHSNIALEDLYFNESAPDDKLLTQGEFCESMGSHGSYTGHYLKYNTAQVNMRTAMASGYFEVTGIVALEYLRHLMLPNGWEAFNELRNAYPNSIIEFGIYDCRLGNQPNNNTLIWEVRDY